jgi:hypothetical protein
MIYIPHDFSTAIIPLSAREVHFRRLSLRLWAYQTKLRKPKSQLFSILYMCFHMFWTRYTTLITVRHTHVSDRLSTNPSAETHFKFFKIGRWLEVQIQRYISGQFNIIIPNHSRFTACSASTEESVSNDLVLSTYNVRSKPLVNRPVFRVATFVQKPSNHWRPRVPKIGATSITTDGTTKHFPFPKSTIAFFISEWDSIEDGHPAWTAARTHTARLSLADLKMYHQA